MGFLALNDRRCHSIESVRKISHDTPAAGSSAMTPSKTLKHEAATGRDVHLGAHNECQSRGTNQGQSFVALWHFHPHIVRQFNALSVGRVYRTLPTFVPPAATKQLWDQNLRHHKADLISETARLAFRKQRRPPQCSYHVVPSYSCSDAQRDLTRLQLSLNKSPPGTKLPVGARIGTPATEVANIVERLETEVRTLRDRIRELEQGMSAAADVRGDNQRQQRLAEGGITRWTLQDDAYHEANPNIAHSFFGLGSWRQTKALIIALFGDDVAPCGTPRTGKLSTFEKCLIAKMAMMISGPKHHVLSSSFNKSRSTISAVLTE